MGAIEIPKTLPLNDALERFDLDFIPSYLVEHHDNAALVAVFEDDAHLDDLYIDQSFDSHDLVGAVFCKNLSASGISSKKPWTTGPCSSSWVTFTPRTFMSAVAMLSFEAT
ncbi:MAG: hypothetical protein ACK5H2_04635 [Beutenbergiaceae bacterium]